MADYKALLSEIWGYAETGFEEYTGDDDDM